MAVVIVKNAGDHWQHYYVEDPKLSKVDASHSCHDTFTGMNLAIQDKYEDIKEAERDVERLNECNPSGDYAICELA